MITKEYKGFTGEYDIDVNIGKLLNTTRLIMFEVSDNSLTTQKSFEDAVDDYLNLCEILDAKSMIQSKKQEILNHVFNSKDGSSWNELTEMLNELIEMCSKTDRL